ncbi:hypothetical protein ABH944_009121, partial [Caballeronia udeis]
ARPLMRETTDRCLMQFVYACPRTAKQRLALTDPQGTLSFLESGHSTRIERRFKIRRYD